MMIVGKVESIGLNWWFSNWHQHQEYDMGKGMNQVNWTG